jgi:Leucine-rich repeat (LRR) protein
MQFFNNKYGTNLSPDMTSLSLEEIYMKNDGLLILSKTNLENLVVLNLSKNNISDISPLRNCSFPKLKKLSLESDHMANPKDKIKDISPLMYTNFPELFILNLKNNLISDISYLLFMNFPNLIILDLSHNQIESVHVFNEVNFPNLETLDLSYNLISDITPFFSSSKKKQPVKNINNSSFANSSSITNFLSKSISSSEITKKNLILPSLKILKLKKNKIIIDEGYLTTVKSLRNRGITIFK